MSEASVVKERTVDESGSGCDRRTKFESAHFASSNDLDSDGVQVSAALAVLTEEHRACKGAKTVAR